MNELYELAKNRIEGEVLQEQYFVGNKTMAQIDALFAEIKTHYTELPDHSLMADAKLGAEKAVKEIIKRIESIIEKEFNFSKADISIAPFIAGGAMINAFTGIGVQGNFSKNRITASESGIKFNEKRYTFNVVIMEAALSSPLFKPRMMTALLLHEIGHSFYYHAYAGDAISSVADTCLDIKYIVEDIKTLKHLKNINDTFGGFNADSIKTGKELKGKITGKIVEGVSSVTNLALSITASFEKTLGKSAIIKSSTQFPVKVIGKLMDSLYVGSDETCAKTKAFKNLYFRTLIEINDIIVSHAGIRNNAKSLIALMSNSAAYKALLTRNCSRMLVHAVLGNSTHSMEHFCDNFATSYGYGKDTIELQQVLMTHANIGASGKGKRKNVLGIVLGELMQLQSILLLSGSSHPASVSRAVLQVKYIEAQLNDPDLASHREVIKKDLEQAKKALQNCDKILKAKSTEDLNLAFKPITKIKTKILLSLDGGLSTRLHKRFDSMGRYRQFESSK